MAQELDRCPRSRALLHDLLPEPWTPGGRERDDDKTEARHMRTRVRRYHKTTTNATLRGDGQVKYRVSIEHHETYIIDASCAAEAQFIAADFAMNRGDSQYAGQVIEHADETLNYVCTQTEACQHTNTFGDEHLDA